MKRICLVGLLLLVFIVISTTCVKDVYIKYRNGTIQAEITQYLYCDTAGTTDVIRTGVMIKTVETVDSVGVKSPTGTNIAMAVDAAVTTDLTTQFPPGVGYKWVGYSSASGTSVKGDYWAKFVIGSVTDRHSMTEKIRRGGDTWANGYSGDFTIGPEPRGGFVVIPGSTGATSPNYAFWVGIVAAIAVAAVLLVRVARYSRRKP
jgi:hypothetical protein